MSDNNRTIVRILNYSFLKWIIPFFLLLVPLWITLYDYGITWDEPIYMEATLKIKQWLSLPSLEMMNPEVINRYWKTDPGRNVHPSGLKWFYIIAQKTIFWEKDPYRQNGLLNILFFSVSIIIFLNWWDKNSYWRPLSYVLILLTIPRFFAHIHFPATDIPMISFLLLFLVYLDRMLFRKSFWLAGIFLGCPLFV
jgi:hypothetical protein